MEEMDSKLWSKLPEDQQVIVLSFLPWYEILRFRVVCAKWNKLLRSREFRQKWRGRKPSQMPICFMGSKGYGTVFYNPVVSKWQSVDRSFVTFKMDEGVYKAPDARVMGSARGLLLLQVLLLPGFAVPNPQSLMHDLFVMNPLDPSNKRRVRLLPHLQYPNTSSILGMVWNDTTRSHQILLQHHPEGLIFHDGSYQDSHMWTFYSYDVENDVWNEITTWPKDRYRDFQSASYVGGRFQCLAKMCNSFLAYGSTPPSAQRFRVYVLDSLVEKRLKESTWVELGDDNGAPPSLPYPLHFAVLFHRERATFVAGGEVTFSLEDDNTDECIELQTFRVWKLHDAVAENTDDKIQWLEVHQMPIEVVETFRKGVNMQFCCSAIDKFLVVSNWWRDCAVLDMSNMTWFTLPPQPRFAESPIREDLFDLYYLHLCEPRLDVVL